MVVATVSTPISQPVGNAEDCMIRSEVDFGFRSSRLNPPDGKGADNTHPCMIRFEMEPITHGSHVQLRFVRKTLAAGTMLLRLTPAFPRNVPLLAH